MRLLPQLSMMSAGRRRIANALAPTVKRTYTTLTKVGIVADYVDSMAFNNENELLFITSAGELRSSSSSASAMLYSNVDVHTEIPSTFKTNASGLTGLSTLSNVPGSPISLYSSSEYLCFAHNGNGIFGYFQAGTYNFIPLYSTGDYSLMFSFANVGSNGDIYATRSNGDLVFREYNGSFFVIANTGIPSVDNYSVAVDKHGRVFALCSTSGGKSIIFFQPTSLNYAECYTLFTTHPSEPPPGGNRPFASRNQGIPYYCDFNAESLLTDKQGTVYYWGERGLVRINDDFTVDLIVGRESPTSLPVSFGHLVTTPPHVDLNGMNISPYFNSASNPFVFDTFGNIFFADYYSDGIYRIS